MDAERGIPAERGIGRGRRGRYGLRTFLTAGFLAAAWFAVLNPWRGVPFLLPAAVAATFSALGAGARAARLACSTMAIGGCLFSLLMAAASYPLIVPADSDLGQGARAMVADWLGLFELSAGAIVVIGLTTVCPWLWVRLLLTLGLLAVVVRVSFESPDMPCEARSALMTLVAVILAAEGLPAFQAGTLRWFPFGRCGWLLFFPALLVTADWQGRIYAGLLPSSTQPRAGDGNLPTASSASIMHGAASRVAVCAAAGLRARAGDDGRLTVEQLRGGPAFHRGEAAPDGVLALVLFSPDGKTLAAADNDRMDRGSRVTIWDVRPGDGRTAPEVALRHELVAEHSCFSLSFFPDGRSLLSSNGDNTVREWDASTGRELACFVPHARPESWDLVACCAAASPDGKTFATWAQGALKLWDRNTLRLLREMDTPQPVPVFLAYTPDGQTLIGAGRQRAGEFVYRWDLHPSALPFFSIVAAAGASLACLVWMSRKTRP